MATDPGLRKIQTAQYYAYRALSKKYPQVYEMFKKFYREGGYKDYTNKSFRALRREHEAEFQELYMAEAEKKGVLTMYARRQRNLARMATILKDADGTKPIKGIRLN